MIIEVFFNTLEAEGAWTYDCGNGIKILSGQSYLKEYPFLADIFGKDNTCALVFDRNSAKDDVKSNFDVYFIPKNGHKSIRFDLTDGEITPLVQPTQRYILLSSRSLVVPIEECIESCEYEGEEPSTCWIKHDSCLSVKCRDENVIITSYPEITYHSYTFRLKDYRVSLCDVEKAIRAYGQYLESKAKG